VSSRSPASAVGGAELTKERAPDRRGRVGAIVLTTLALVDLAVYGAAEAVHKYGAVGLAAITASGLLITPELYGPLIRWEWLKNTARQVRLRRQRINTVLKVILFLMLFVPVLTLDFAPVSVRAWLIPVSIAAFFLAYTIVWAAYMLNVFAEALADDWVSRKVGRLLDSHLAPWRRPLAFWLFVAGLLLQYVETFRH
jgi:hypothetical protein